MVSVQSSCAESTAGSHSSELPCSLYQSRLASSTLLRPAPNDECGTAPHGDCGTQVSSGTAGGATGKPQRSRSEMYGLARFISWAAGYLGLRATTVGAIEEALIHVMALAPTARSVGLARQFASDVLADYDVELRDIVVLLVSEVVSNAIQHGGPHEPSETVGLALETRSDSIRVEVTDGGAGEPLIGDGALDRLSGRGLLLVQTLANCSGCDRLSVGKTVWFEVRTPYVNGRSLLPQ